MTIPLTISRVGPGPVRKVESGSNFGPKKTRSVQSDKNEEKK